jgi:hypothetical protein
MAEGGDLHGAALATSMDAARGGVR